MKKTKIVQFNIVTTARVLEWEPGQIIHIAYGMNDEGFNKGEFFWIHHECDHKGKNSSGKNLLRAFGTIIETGRPVHPYLLEANFKGRAEVDAITLERMKAESAPQESIDRYLEYSKRTVLDTIKRHQEWNISINEVDLTENKAYLYEFEKVMCWGSGAAPICEVYFWRHKPNPESQFSMDTNY